MSSTKLERGSYWATIVAAAVATLAFGFGYFQFSATQEAQRETLELERESQAVELFSKYNELMRDAQPNPGPSPSPSPSPSPNPSPSNTDPEFWKNNLAVSIAESIFKLRREDEGWVETVGWMLQHHTKHLKERGLNCKTFDKDFIKFVNQEMGQDVCRP